MNNVERISNTRRLHSPGPWHVLYSPSVYSCVSVRSASTGRQVAEVFSPSRLFVPETNANAALLAAAPDLLEKLEAVIAAVRGQPLHELPDLEDAVVDAHALIEELRLSIEGVDAGGAA